MSSNIVKLPKRRIFTTPMPLRTDAYTSGSPIFQSSDAIFNSVYYITHRKPLNGHDHRIVSVGLSNIIEDLFYDPITHEDIDESVASLAKFQVSTNGFRPYPFPVALWRRVVDEFNGRPPIKIESVREGTVVYPNEPVVQVRTMVAGFGELAAWVEAKLLQVYGTSERVTRNEHFLADLKAELVKINHELTDEEVQFHCENMLIDFGDRAGLNQRESEDLGKVHLYTFPGTDNLSGHYQAFKNSGNVGQGSSILALAHRNIQAYVHEDDCYQALNEAMEPGDLASFVLDCYNYKTAVVKYAIPTVIRNMESKNGKIMVFRPDSGDVVEQLLWTLEQLALNGLIQGEYRVDSFGERKLWKSPMHCKLILADGLTMADMLDIVDVLTVNGYEFHKTIVFGSGGGLRNLLKRDNLSSKFAMGAKGEHNDPVCKFSEDSGKVTLPGPLKLLRNKEAILSNRTVVHEDEDGDSILETFYDGSDIWNPFGAPMNDSEDFPTIKARIRQQMTIMPLKLHETERYPISYHLRWLRENINASHKAK
jgi:nicotinic acid phosphoribosyltransferase